MDLKSTLPAPLRRKCPECANEVVVLLHGLTRFVCCSGCGRGFVRDTATGLLTERRRYRTRTYKPYLLPGDEGVLFGRRYVVTGWVRKKEKGTSYSWAEHHLFNPVHGFAQLSVYEGHWTFHEQLKVYPRDPGIHGILLFDRNAYEPYNGYGCTVVEAEGEFTRDVNEDERAEVRELISPPYMLTREVEPDELAWYMGRYLEPAEVREAFAKTAPPPVRTGVGAAQPQKLAIDVNVLKTISVIAGLVLLITQVLLATLDAPVSVHSGTYTSRVDTLGQPVALESPSFKLERERSAVELAVHPLGLDNNWFELAGALINEGTGETRAFSFNIEYYHGYEQGEHWSEGGTKDGIVFSSLPAGTYHLEFYPAFDAKRPVSGFEARLSAVPILWSNMWLIMLLAGAFPLITWYRVTRFEANRWGE